ncbi:C-reactive protein-like [Chanos chanos]|uniref:Pentraxin family member n=1 Tax=Chanos chanos TaxID=29144 RepID=A0A6J2VB90_CHACN|nr:C-reactive protein-like [Chanos chanos]
MEQLLYLLAITATCVAFPQDLSGKMFTFPVGSNTDHVRLMPSRENFTSVSVCLRSFTDLSRGHTLFSLATQTHFNDIVLFKRNQDDQIRLHIRDGTADFMGQSYGLNRWHSICLTWHSETGLGQIWLDGQPSARKFVRSGEAINGSTFIVLGQDQDRFGGGFNTRQSFVGMLADVHMWDYVLSYCEITRFTNNDNFTPGNILNWRGLEFDSIGNVIVENRTPEYCF